MLFNSAGFILGFLPVVLLGFVLLAGGGHRRFAGLWLTAASLVFYGWWNPIYVPLLLASMTANFWLGGLLRRHPTRALLIAGIAANVLLLAYFKYTGFLVQVADQVTGAGWSAPQIILPLAISFYTFQQIAYLSDAHDGAVGEHNFSNYCLFITFFPHLIAGPITHHKEMLEQFEDPDGFRPRIDTMAVGATLFLMGLFKKVVLADPMGAEAAPVFAAAADGASLAMLDAWTGALSYTLQLYFDFSGYSDMAIGLGLLFGISLPANFDSPYKAQNIIQYWSRWHMTLTRFLTTYIYTPLVLRATRARVAAGKPLPRRGKMTPGAFLHLVAWPTIATLMISGVWHGAGWQFVAFGALHAFYLVVAHGWRAFKASRGMPLDSSNPLKHGVAVLTTFVCVVIGAVFFRSADLTSALTLLAGMAGLHGFEFPPVLAELPGLASVIAALGVNVAQPDFFRPTTALQIAVLLAFCWTLPNSQQWLRAARTALGWKPWSSWMERSMPWLSWRPNAAVGVAVGVVGFYALARALSAAPTEFLYFQF
ncbi:alginate O-acetyltransferase [Pseudoroseomonas deserti]|uniref:Probable alginate O-acetylase AlgI n=1 Tax=Teichococcus deserti TaxID=1817963 RepID=A0A1V2H862_9PROT|nr:MBOAT family O-acyltransferase [Pseudoroseomonas deserti]ONG58942.1 alginate O-acetyltransferase [Pseudoroseomonas deserti]